MNILTKTHVDFCHKSDATYQDANDSYDAPTDPSDEKKTTRDEWMMIPPKQDDLAARMDPTKQRARKFNTGKGAKGPAGPGGMDSSWTETPDQKRKRLADEVMGVAAPEKSAAERQVRKKEDTETERRMREKAVRLTNSPESLPNIC